MQATSWIEACNAEDIEDEEVVRFDHGERSFAIYNLAGTYHATEGYCTHQREHLADGLVMDGIIECPLHMGQFDIETGEALAGPVCLDLETYETRVEAGKIYLKV